MDNSTNVHFVDSGTELTAVEIDQRGRSPFISKLHHVLFALGVVVSTYQVRVTSEGLVERLVLQRDDGTAITGELRGLTRAAVMPIAMAEEGDVDQLGVT